MATKKETGGPAFPEKRRVMRAGYVTNDLEPVSGMTMRDYFMAHAPAEPQKWFNPVMPPCPVVPSVRSLPAGELRSELLDTDGADVVSQEAKDWLLERDLLAAKQSDWQDEFRKQLYVQWPAAWADAMLEQRKC